MVQFIDVDPDDIQDLAESRRGRFSYPIVKSFLETGKAIAQLDRSDMNKTAQQVSVTLGFYIRKHDLPIRLVTRRGELYMVRKDLNADGSPNPDYQPSTNGRGSRGYHTTNAAASFKDHGDDEAAVVDADEVLRRLEHPVLETGV
jgi:hypothetical protein